MAAPQAAYSLFGTPKYAKGFTHFDYVNPDAPKGGTLRLSHPVAFDSLNGFIIKGVTAPGISLIYQPLMASSADEPQSVYSAIAQTIDIRSGGKEIRFRLNPKARWHDGEPITAEDVVFTFETLKEKGHPQYRILYHDVEKAEALSPREVRFTISNTENRELPLLLSGLYVLPKHYYDTHDFGKTTLEPPLGSGPYKVAEVDQGRSITYERVQDFWGKDLPVYIGKNNFDVIRYDVFRDETVSLEGIKSGRYDFREEFIARNWATAYDIPAVASGELIKVKIPNKIPSGMQAFLFNTRLDKFSDARVREAIGLTMDFEWMNRVLFYGAYNRSQSFFQNTDMMATGLPSESELKLLESYKDSLPPRLFTEPFRIPVTDGSGHTREMLIRAQELLNDAGWVMRDGVRVNAKTGEPLTIEFMMRQRTFERVIGMMQKNLKRLGIASSFRYVDDSQYQKRIDSRDFDVISIWWNLGIHFPGNEQKGFWHSAQADVQGGNNYSGLKNPAVDAVLDKLTSAKDLEQLTTAAHALDRVLLWNHVVIPHWYLGAWRVAYWDKFGKPDITPDYDISLDSWWDKSLEPVTHEEAAP